MELTIENKKFFFAGLKKCCTCKSLYTLDKFTADKHAKDGIRPQCSFCTYLKQGKVWNGKSRSAFKLARYGNYKISEIDYLILESRQDKKCAICRRERPLRVDHDHQTGEIRGLLCDGCNTALGKLGDNTEGLEKALIYLRGDQNRTYN